METWQRRLAARWVEVERHKRQMANAERMKKIGEAQDRVLTALFEEANRRRRRDLTRFLLLAAGPTLGACPSAGDWLAQLAVRELPTSERIAVYRLALAPLRKLLELRQQRREAESVGYFDDGYSEAQFWKSEWERLGADKLCTAAEAIVRAAEPL